MGNLASDRKCMRTFSLKLSKNTDADIISRLESVDNIQGYIKGLIRADMKPQELRIDSKPAKENPLK